MGCIGYAYVAVRRSWKSEKDTGVYFRWVLGLSVVLAVVWLVKMRERQIKCRPKIGPLSLTNHIHQNDVAVDTIAVCIYCVVYRAGRMADPHAGAPGPPRTTTRGTTSTRE
ncbi:hypothetical protein PCH_Pc22g25950 [Penicillium rubens Wisconsin 54-1255]|uniref:Uncharacterized protein n=1 Tax=Penicillium rubens (strain ATCC 28089 / DSM 1075 / NRRL 1951 / Wisconsin 54-1255) TaxID=500485 RepID=B6HT03_PENRW|nr:hypothetical protein PCH_Pc22g25950 [Penicillium rubens Wisconsin 54-1255]